MAVGFVDGRVRLFNAETGDQIGSDFVGHEDRVVAIAISTDGSLMVTAGAMDNTARLWQIPSGTVSQTFLHSGAVWTVDISAAGTLVVVGGYGTQNSGNCCTVWSVLAGVPVTPVAAQNEVNSARFVCDGAWILTTSSDQTAALTEVATGSTFAVFVGHSAPVNDAAMSPDCSLVATAGHDAVKVWDVETLQCVSTLDGGGANSVAFSPDGNYLAAGGMDGTPKLWHVGSWCRVHTYFGAHLPGGPIYDAALSPDGALLLTAGGADRTARIWTTECRLDGDLNSDGQVALPDLAGLLANFGQPTACPTDGDLDGDGQVGLPDLAGLLASFGCSCPL
ncbi:MAG: WD40 repeat domain-containing protein [Phycisphaerales bacterium]|nr:WD40 repeat domain-containing protein [Phycisphaerales bacterium]